MGGEANSAVSILTVQHSPPFHPSTANFQAQSTNIHTPASLSASSLPSGSSRRRLSSSPSIAWWSPYTARGTRPSSARSLNHLCVQVCSCVCVCVSVCVWGGGSAPLPSIHGAIVVQCMHCTPHLVFDSMQPEPLQQHKKRLTLPPTHTHLSISLACVSSVSGSAARAASAVASAAGAATAVC